MPNLRLVRGEDLLGNRYALAVQNSTISELILPRLTQITVGDVLFENSGELCNYKTINWNDILDNGNLTQVNTCPNPGQASKLIHC